jgi:hypothetical protein
LNSRLLLRSQDHFLFRFKRSRMTTRFTHHLTISMWTLYFL